jgi:hypothetical protein
MPQQQKLIFENSIALHGDFAFIQKPCPLFAGFEVFRSMFLGICWKEQYGLDKNC